MYKKGNAMKSLEPHQIEMRIVYLHFIVVKTHGAPIRAYNILTLYNAICKDARPKHINNNIKLSICMIKRTLAVRNNAAHSGTKPQKAGEKSKKNIFSRDF